MVLFYDDWCSWLYTPLFIHIFPDLKYRLIYLFCVAFACILRQNLLIRKKEQVGLESFYLDECDGVSKFEGKVDHLSKCMKIWKLN